jgi:Holliday junction resolvase-like predicted endonuclease
VTWVNREEITVPLKQRFELVFFALREGIAIEQICTALGWQDFEDVTAHILRQHGFTVTTHFRFTLLRRRYEIDVVGYKDPLIFSVECKRWTRGWRRAAIIKAVESQIERTNALSQSSLTLSEKMKIRIRNETRFVPILVSLSNGPFQFFRQMPIISISQLNSFLTEGNY